MPLNLDRGPDELYDVGAPLSVTDYLRALWWRRDFILLVPLGRLRAQTHSTVLGGVWHLLNPLLFAAVYYFVFGIIFRGRDDIPNYAAFVVLLTGESFAATWLLIVPILLLQCMFNLGLAMVIARLAFHFRDIQQFLPYLLRMWLYLSGIFYTLEFVEQRLSDTRWLVTLFELNPIYAYAALVRAALLSDYAVGGFEIAVAAVWAIGLVVGGFFFFRAREIEYSDV
jgi:ABC-type polysaccharide/polyol phosphate export permease